MQGSMRQEVVGSDWEVALLEARLGEVGKYNNRCGILPKVKNSTVHVHLLL